MTDKQSQENTNTTQPTDNEALLKLLEWVHQMLLDADIRSAALRI